LGSEFISEKDQRRRPFYFSFQKYDTAENEKHLIFALNDQGKEIPRADSGIDPFEKFSWLPLWRSEMDKAQWKDQLKWKRERLDLLLKVHEREVRNTENILGTKQSNEHRFWKIEKFLRQEAQYR